MRISDWSSDVCSSDLHAIGPNGPFPRPRPSTLAGHPGPHTLQPFRRIAVVLKELMGPPEHRLGVGLDRVERIAIVGMVGTFARVAHEYERAGAHGAGIAADRKSTRLNSSH